MRGRALAGAVACGLTAGALAPAAAGAGEIRFRDAAEAWGLAFRHHHGGSGEFYMMETMGSGVAVFDYDGDGDPDVLLVDGGALPGYRGEPPRTILFRNDGGRFVDVTAAAGLDVTVYGMGAAAGDVDGDGDLDLYVTGYGPNQLFRNDGDGTFTDVTSRAGVGDPAWSMSAAFADLDRDGDLDLYVTNYLDAGLDNNPPCGNPERGIRTYCHPDAFDGLPDTYYRNRGDGTFEDATAAAGLGMARGNGMGVVVSDFDGDGWPDLYVANDMTPNYLFRNRGPGEDGEVVFEDVALLSGTALSDRGNAEAGMGVEVGDLDGDGGPEIMVTHMEEQTNAVYSAAGPWIFTDRRFVSRLAEPSAGKVGFGVAFADLDHDRDLDVVVANGHIIDNDEILPEGTSYRQPNQVFENLGAGRFRELPDGGLDALRVSRGLAAGDLDGDGDLDLVINNSNDLAEVYENATAATGAWLRIALERPGGNRFGVGARIAVEAGGGRQWREVRTASSYLSQNELSAHFGLGEAEEARVTVRWPDGAVQAVEGVPVGRRVALVRDEPAGRPRAVP